MKTLLTVIFLTLPCFAQKDIKVVLTNASISVWNRRPASGENIYKKKDPSVRDMQLSFTMRIATSESRAYPITPTVYFLVESKDGSRKWRSIFGEDVSGLKWTIHNKQSKELNAKEVVGSHKVNAGIRDVNGKIIAWSVKAISRYDEGNETKFNTPVMFEWKDKNAKGIKNPPTTGSRLEEMP